MEYLVTAGYIVLCVLLFSLAIAIHEFGHFIVALKLGLTVKCFSIGFGPAIWKKTWRGVEYRISCIPLGGYVSIPDVDPEGTKVIEGEGGKKAPKKNIPAWKELLVAVAGPGMNLLLAVVLALLLAAVPSARFGELPAEISKVLENGPAAKAGIKTGDTVIAVGGRKVANWIEMQVEFQIAGEKATEVLLKDKNGAERTVTVVPERDKASGACFIKALSLPNEKMSSSWMPHRNPLRQLAWDAGSIFRILKGLVNPKESKNTAKALGGPQMIAEQIYRSIRKDIWDGVGFLRFLNVNLAIFNLLPIPVLDGGLIMFALIAVIFRRRVPEKVVSSLSLFFMVLLFAAMGTLVFRDAQRSWRLHNQEKADVQQKSDQVTEDR